jgi:hypothetical protein
MCLVSEKIKFCTCLTDSVDKLNNYWILHRFNANKEDFVLGITIMPSEYTDAHFLENTQTLVNRLNAPDAFDMPMTFNEKDQFELVINNHAKEEGQRLTYCFRHTKGAWIKEPYDVFELMNQYDEFMFGKMKGIKKKLNK